MSVPDGLLTSGYYKHDVGLDPDCIPLDPSSTSDDCLDVFSPVYQFLPLEPEELNTMNPSEDEPSSGLNGRLRPRKTPIPSPLSIKQTANKYDGKQTQEKPKQSRTPSKASPSKPEDLSNNPTPSPTPQLLCPYCDRKFGSKQTVSKHIRRLHLSTSKIESSIVCLFCNHVETEPSDIIRHMIDSHPNQYFACLDCHTRFPSTKELAEHKLNICEKQKITYRSKLRRKPTKKSQKAINSQEKVDFSEHGFDGIVISCELKPAHIHDEADIEDNITTNLILPPNKNITTSSALEKNAVIVLDDIQWNRRIPSNFAFHNTDADQILSRLGVVHRSPKTGEPTKKDWFRAIEDATQKFEKCFDTSFYSKVASNVQENLTKFLDGSFNFNPDADSTIKTRKSKNSVVIHTAEGFPILLACEQFSRNSYDGYIPRTIAPKHKWKWDNLENEKPFNPDQIKRDTHANNCIITLVSSLDIWTQLCMRRKFEDKFNVTPVEKKTEKQNVISKELKEILESREIPSTNSQIAKSSNTPLLNTNDQDFPNFLGLMPSAPKFDVKPAVLSGEWVRPRCYVCCACGAQSRDSRALSVHVSSKHPNAQVQHYEIVGESLLKADILKHLYVPPNQNVNRTRPPRGFRDCTKCMKSITIEDLHQHMLDCAGDTPTVRRKCRHRPFGMRKRRPRLPDNRIRKKIRNDIRTRPSRQKNRMRPKPKIRSEVGDAETIRKMLADLPAKRHRVLVNPSNSILRPRRKIDKQRALRMLKRHTSEELKTKPKQINPTTHYDHQQTTSNAERYKSINNRDDEDNEPLIRSRLKRVASKITRQKESLNRKTILKKPKRKVRLLTEKKENEGDEKASPLKVQTEELSLDHSEKRINVNENPQNYREHSTGGHGDSNNDRRDNQRPGSSGQNGNSRNVCEPSQNVPLKHSIARLTANSETHDKSVQFHHLFLVQQECNNTNEHVPSGQRLLFENEAIVTKLDKPPLHFRPNISLDTVKELNIDTVQENNLESNQIQASDSIHKNKLNKPRKGLNDCIAMLKNKLVDTEPNAPAHVSVQCGTDDLISSDPVLTNNPTSISPRVDVVMKTLQVCPTKDQSKKKSSKSVPRTEQLPKPSPLYREQYINHDMHGLINNEIPTTQWRPVNYDAIMPRFIDNRTRKETTRRRSTSQQENLFFAQQLLCVTPPNNDILLKLSAEPYNAYNLPPQKSPKNYQEQFNVHGTNNTSKYGKRKVLDKPPPETSNGSLQNSAKSGNNQNKKSDCSKRSTRTRVTTPKKPVENFEKLVHKDISKSTKNTIEKARNQLLDCQVQRESTNITTVEKKNDSYSHATRRRRSSNAKSEVILTSFKQVEPQLNADLKVTNPVNVYSEHNLTENIVLIPAAHASTNVESMLPVPLDLSSKTPSVCTDHSSRLDSTALPNYDRYETLDLSNKRRINIDHRSEYEVVDLRVKSKSPFPSTSQEKIITLTALNLIQQNDYVPTDLSIKRKDVDTNLCINLSKKRNLDEAEVQDLSKNKMNPISSLHRLEIDEEVPTDLSKKSIANVHDIALSIEDSNKKDSIAARTICDDPREQDRANDLSGKVIHEKLADPDPTILTIDKNATPEETNNIIYENMNNIEEIPVITETSISGDMLSQVQKPIYDPTLRIPQYKIRPKGTDSTSKEVNVIDPPVTIVTTSVENYSSQQNSINSTTHSICLSQNSTVKNNPMVASIEVQERITYSFTKSVINTVVTSVIGSLPAYSLLNRGMTTPFTTFESTRPVYALPNTCISMSKMDVTTNSLLSIPSTTIISTSPVYTLAGTTLVKPLCVTLPNSGQSIPYPPPCGSYLPEIDTQITTHYSSPNSTNIHEGRAYDTNILIRGPLFNFDRDQEIPKQMTSLQKDIAAILNDMPIDHRKQLLHVLLRYLSFSRPIPILSTLFQNPGPSIPPIPIKPPRESTVDASTDTVDIKPIYTLPTVEDQSRVQQNDKSSKSSFPSEVKQTDTVLENQIIDLTYDEIVPKIDLDIELNDKHQLSIKTTDEAPPAIASASMTQKTNNEKTASLRAVRIKAPSERQQLKTIAKPVETLPCAVIPIAPNENVENQLNLSPHIDITSEIQMYEVSSTQSNKKKMLESELLGKSLPQPPLQPTSDNVSKPHNDSVSNEHGENLQSLSLQANPNESMLPGTGLIGHETERHSILTENVSLIIKENLTNTESSEGNDKIRDVSPVPNLSESLVVNNLNKIDEDDDSDDDISLAAIVKQKQLKQNKIREPQTETHIEETNKAIPSETSEVREDGVTITSKVEGETNKNSNDLSFASKLQNVSRTGFQFKSKQSKKKGKKNDKSAKRVKMCGKKKINVIEPELDINTERVNISEELKNREETALKLNSKQQKITPDETSTKNYEAKNFEISKNVSTTTLKCILDKQAEPKVIDINTIQNKASKKFTVDQEIDNSNKILAQNIEHNTVNQEADNNSHKILAQNVENITANQEADNSNKILAQNVENNTQEEILNTKEQAVQNIDDDPPLSALEKNEEILTIGSSISNNCMKIYNKEDDALPLRRSKRGKSLFMECNDQVLICPDTFSEQKAPLTKKQLIFSKLLLDEENNFKKDTSVDDKRINIEENSTCLQAKSEISSEEKNKSIKRKKSPHSKKKSKKKKYINSSEPISSHEKDGKKFAQHSGLKNDDSVHIEIDITANNDVCLGIELESGITKTQKKLDSDNNNECPSDSINIKAEQNKATVSGNNLKRKIDLTLSENIETSIHGLTSKKLKLNSLTHISGSLHSEITTSENNNHHLPLAARRARSKSVVVKSSGSMLYDPYDIDLEDMGDVTEPFRKQRSTILRTDANNLNIDNRPNEDTNIDVNLNAIDSKIVTGKDSKEIVSDSDESSKSDVPLKKYVEEKERKNQLWETRNAKPIGQNVIDESQSNEDDIKYSRKKQKKNKRSVTIVHNVQKEDKNDKEVTEEQRSEQFMESFGFFSERKPRKSNLLATKKISETFHIIANESDDIYLDTRDRQTKKSSRNEGKKIVEENIDKFSKLSEPPKSSSKCDKNLKLRSATLYCHLCKKEFRRIDNLVRHQLSLSHASKLSGNELKLASSANTDDFNYLVVFKEHMDRLRILEQKMKSKKQSKTKFTLPSLHQILLDVHKSIREKQLARRNLSRDQALFLDCCELLKDSNRGQIEDRNIIRPLFPCCSSSQSLACTNANEYDPNSGLSLEFSRYTKRDRRPDDLLKKPVIHTSARLSGMANFVPLSSTSKQISGTDRYSVPSTSTSGLDPSYKAFDPTSKSSIIDEIIDEKYDSKSEGDVDSITAQNILESEEVRNLENDLLSGLKEAACKFQPLLGTADKATENNVHNNCIEDQIEDASAKKDNVSKAKITLDTKEKKSLDLIDNIDMFEDKFDKIKRKCRSQAAAAKLAQTCVEPNASYKSRKKLDKKKGKRNSKKHNQNTVLTKGALKGYDSIKVSILTSEIDMSAIVPSIVNSKKKKKRSSKKRRDRKKSILPRKLDPNSSKDSPHKNIDVYEFLDNEEPEIFELRPSTVMERFRNLNKKDTQSSTKITHNNDDALSSDSMSDGDDFVYMSDDYVCSDDETENSLMSCEMGNVKGNSEVKKPISPLKRKDVMEKNAVMGKIFKHNAVRSEKKSTNIKPKESIKPKANLDQLFDSLLEEEPNSSLLNNDDESPTTDSTLQKKRVFSPIILSKYESKATKNNDCPDKIRTPSPALSSDSVVSRRISSFSSRHSSPRRLSSSPINFGSSISKKHNDLKKCDKISKDNELTPMKVPDVASEKELDLSLSNNFNINENLVVSPNSDMILYDNCQVKSTKDKSFSRMKEKVEEYRTSYNFKADYYDDDAFSDDAGVARQRARRKCTVGKQNVLAETWSSESELDSMPPRPNSAESMIMNVARKKKGKKRDGQMCGGRKGNKHVSVKKQDIESRVSTNRTSESTSVGSSESTKYTQQLSLPGPSGVGPRLRTSTSFWADGAEEPEHIQQHGWIVGDSHKKLVTMLAHAKGRKRYTDDKVRLNE